MACASAVDQRADKKPAPNMNPKARERRMRFMRPSEGRQLKQLLTRASQNRSIPMGASSIPRFLKRYQGMKVGVCQRSIEPQTLTKTDTHLRSLKATMSQKSSLLQSAKSVSQVLTSSSLRARNARRETRRAGERSRRRALRK